MPERGTLSDLSGQTIDDTCECRCRRPDRLVFDRTESEQETVAKRRSALVERMPASMLESMANRAMVTVHTLPPRYRDVTIHLIWRRDLHLPALRRLIDMIGSMREGHTPAQDLAV